MRHKCCFVKINDMDEVGPITRRRRATITSARENVSLKRMNRKGIQNVQGNGNNVVFKQNVSEIPSSKTPTERRNRKNAPIESLR